MDVYIGRRRVNLGKLIGKGGEASIYEIGDGKVLKLYHDPDHPDYQGSPAKQDAARRRLQLHQDKLPAFPKNLPDHVIAPQQLATDRTGKRIIGYTMAQVPDAEVLYAYGDRDFRKGTGIGNNLIPKLFLTLHGQIRAIHSASVVMGDFNDFNVLVRTDPNLEVFMIDADSFQFAAFLCTTFTVQYVDPLLCQINPAAAHNADLPPFVLVRPYNAQADWYAFAAMLMQCLLFVHPYGGVYLPKDAAKSMPDRVRPMYRITIFDPEVNYPRPAIPYKVLPDDLLHYFHQIFKQDSRGEFPKALLENLRWTKCMQCGIEHCRSTCPQCAAAAPGAIKEITIVRKGVTVTRVFSTPGIILFAAVQDGTLRWLYHEDNAFRRENGQVALSGRPDSHMRFRIHGQETSIGKRGQVVTHHPQRPLDTLSVDSFGMLPVFDANANSRYWTTNGQLFRDGQFGQEYIGDILSGQTLFWVGPSFGFGFYRAGFMQVAFVFDAQHRGINDTVQLPLLTGLLADSSAVFSESRCWFFAATKDSGMIRYQCAVIRSDGSVEATAQATQGDGSWLSRVRGMCAAGRLLFVPTDDGIVRVEVQGKNLVKTAVFPQTTQLVDAGSYLLAGKDGLYVVNEHEINLLRIT